ncbi:MAG: hypothetical protein AB8H80_13740 [Planctomycetota bacterium]
MRRALAASLLLPLVGCQYVDERLTDLHDCFIYRWHDNALGVAADVRVGPLGVTVGGWYSDWGQGKDTWWQKPGFTLTNHGTGIPFTTLGPLGYGQDWSRFLATGSIGNHIEDPSAYDDVRSWVFLYDAFDWDDQGPFALTTTQRIVDLFGVEVGIAPLFTQLHVGFNIAEFADFTLGLVGLDLFGDDHVPRPPTVPFVPDGR